MHSWCASKLTITNSYEIGHDNNANNKREKEDVSIPQSQYRNQNIICGLNIACGRIDSGGF